MQRKLWLQGQFLPDKRPHDAEGRHGRFFSDVGDGMRASYLTNHRPTQGTHV